MVYLVVTGEVGVVFGVTQGQGQVRTTAAVRLFLILVTPLH